MSIKSKVIAAAATLTLVGGVSTVGALTAATAGAATPSCGASCFDFFSRDFGATPNFVVDVFRQGAKVGQPIILFKASNSDPAEDFTFGNQGTVADFLAAGLVSTAVALHYGCTTPPFATCTPPRANDQAFELEYAPFGVDTGLCVGLFATASAGEKVTLQPCGVSSKTVWIQDNAGNRGNPNLSTAFLPLINGSDTNFSHPFVLTYPKNGFPTDIPRPQLTVNNLTGFSNGSGPILGSVSSNQLYSFVTGVLP
jgi:hypothetical protein